MFCSKGLKKETYFYGYGPLHLIQQRWNYCDDSDIAKGVLHFNRRDIFEWLLTDEDGYNGLKWLCFNTIMQTSARLDILREVFDRADERQLEYLRDCNSAFDLCATAAHYGKIECLKFLRQNRCEWGEWAWFYANNKGYDHILEYLQNNGYPTEWQD